MSLLFYFSDLLPYTWGQLDMKVALSTLNATSLSDLSFIDTMLPELGPEHICAHLHVPTIAGLNWP